MAKVIETNSRHSVRLLRLAAAVLAWTVAGIPALGAENAKPTEYRVKAAYLYNFGRFVEWPAKASVAIDEPFAICVLGQDPFGATLDTTLAGETIDRAHVVARRISKPQDAVSCRILFISSSQQEQLKEILIALQNVSVLTVSDMPQFARRGGMVQFLLDGSRVRFEVNLIAAEQAGLNLSSELLKLAVNVKKRSP